jgi:hypothetical protein
LIIVLFSFRVTDMHVILTFLEWTVVWIY